MHFCGLCKVKLPSFQDFERHLTDLHPEAQQNEYICHEKDCYRIFDSWHAFKKHLSSKHGISIVGENHHQRYDQTELNKLNYSAIDVHGREDQVANEYRSTSENEYPSSTPGDDFKASLDSRVEKFVAKLYANKRLPRIMVQKIIDDVKPFFGENVLKVLELEDPFKNLSSDYKRLSYFKKIGNYIVPQSYVIKKISVSKKVMGKMQKVPTEICGQFIPLREVLQKFFELPNALSDTLNYMNFLYENSSMVQNFIQCDLWRDKRSRYQSTDIVLPLFINTDDVELNNPLGSHTGKVAAVYASVPCLPPECRSLLDNYFLVLLYASWIRKPLPGENEEELSNKIYRPLVEELTHLETIGININTTQGVKRVYFVLGLLLGDNLGINGILGMVESFSANYRCRFCKMPKKDCRVATEHDPNTLRTVDDYEQDVSLDDPSRTGLKFRSPFNQIPSYHVMNNAFVDEFHDGDEGVKAYTMKLIITGLTSGEHKEFELNCLNDRILAFDYGPIDQNNKPPVITRDDLKKQKLKMKGAEMSCFVKYFGLLVGDLVSEKNPFWKLYILGRRVYEIILAKKISKEEASQLPTLMRQHHTLYLELSKMHIVPKFHFWLHYFAVFLQSGPIVNLSCIRFEAKHRDVTAPASVTTSRVNIASTVANKHQLNMSFRFMNNQSILPPIIWSKKRNALGPRELSTLPNDLLSQELFSVRWVEFKGTTFKPRMVLVIGTENLALTFGLIETIIIKDSTGYPGFICTKLENLGLDEHVWAYLVAPTEERIFVQVTELFDSFPLYMQTITTGERYVVLRSSI